MQQQSREKVYRDATYISTTTVRHGGTTVAFAMDSERRIHYSVLDLEQAQDLRGALDVNYWNADSALLSFPREIVDIGVAVPVARTMPTVKAGGRVESRPGELLPGESDTFLSTTARLTAASPIQAVSDGRHIFVFRRSVTALDHDAVFQGVGTSLSADPVLTAGDRVPAVDASLLCDRYVLVGSVLKPVVEVRYRRSRSKFVPASEGTDTLGTRDMDGVPFYEPTSKLSFVPRIDHGGFAVLLLPTEVDGRSRWQLFVNDAAERRIESVNCAQGDDGLFDIAGTQLYTSPDPRFSASVLEREPGIDPHTGLPLVPVPASTDRAATALRFDPALPGAVTLRTEGLPPASGGFTFEAWIRPVAPGGTIVATRDESRPDGFRLGVDASGSLILGQGAQDRHLTGSVPVPFGVYSHVAAVFDGLTVTLFVDGVPSGTGTIPVAPAPGSADLLGMRGSTGDPVAPFTGDIDEVRVWNRVRTETELADRGRRLVGIEAGLISYLRFDEGTGDRVADLCRGRSAASVSGAVWVPSDAPVGDGPGLSRDVFALKDRNVVGGLAATLYFQQEPRPTGYSDSALEKRQARVLLAGATSGPAPEGGSDARAYVCTVDFALSRGGRLAAVPREIALEAIGLPDPARDLDALTAAQARVAAAQAALGTDQALADKLWPTLEYIADIRRFSFRDQQRAQLERTVPAMVMAQQRLGSGRAQVDAAKAALATLTGGLLGGPETVLEMPRIAVDRSGLSAYGALLTFAWTTDAPSLLESATGDVVMYFRGGDGQFFAAYYPTTVSRAARRLPAGTGEVTLTARDTATRLADLRITVGDGSSAGLCRVALTQGPVTETFEEVPREAVSFARALNGTRAPGTLLGRAVSVSGTTLTLDTPLARALEAGGTVWVGGTERTLAGPVATGATQVRLTAHASIVSVGQELRTALYDYAHARSSTPGAVLGHGSQLVSATALGAGPQVANGTALDLAEPLLPRWRGNTPGRALSFDGHSRHLTLPSSAWPDITPSGDLTVEAWVNPATLTGNGARIWHASIPGFRYALALEGGAAISALLLDGASWVDCGTALTLADRDFTIEVWANAAGNSRLSPLFSSGSTADADPVFLAFTPDNRLAFSTAGSQLTTDPFPEGGWHCWSAVFEAATGRRTLYRDGVQIAQDIAPGRPGGGGRTTLGCFGFAGAGQERPATAMVDEYRVWGRARTQAEVAGSAHRRLTGHEPGLLGYWTFGDASTADRSGNGHHGTVRGRLIPCPSAPRGYGLAAVVGSQAFRSEGVFPAADWGHVAMTFRQDWALAMDGTGHLDAAGPEGLDLVDDLTIEAYVKLDALGSMQGLVGKGPVQGGGSGAVPYALYVDPDGQLVFTFEAGGGGTGSQQIWRSGEANKLAPGVFTKVAVTRRGGEDKDGAVGIRLYIDGRLVRTDRYTGARPVGNDANCQIGRYRVGSSSYGLRGTVSEVRIWKVARKPEEIGVPVTTKAEGLVAWWNVPESHGAITADACDTFPARVHGAVRVRTPDPHGNRFTFYHNGVPTAADRVSMDNVLGDMGPEQVTVAARRTGSGALSEVLTGTLDEIRVWRTCRTQEQILDNLFTRVRGERQDLMAYYPFDPESTVAGAKVADAGLRGCDLEPSVPAPEVVVSTAPLSDDTAEVRSALAGASTAFHRRVSATPSASEYADLQTDAHGTAIGVMKRAYSSVRAGAWVLGTGFKVGDLTTSWVGQAQFNPQLVGYLEGAPPVPSENMIEGTAEDYSGTSSVSFVQADTVTNTMSSDHKTSVDSSAKITFDVSQNDDTFIVAAPLGAGTAKPLSSLKIHAGGSAEMKFSNSWSNDTTVSQGATTTRTSSVKLAGRWESPEAKEQANPTAGRRWLPANTGFAIVQSDTADQFALRLAHNGALVAYRMIPNPDIPRDWNIIAFPINPLYTKQGTLDGVIGFRTRGAAGGLEPCPDPSFPHAGDGGQYSYYRPREAYALKRRIQREEQQLQAFYESASTDTHAPDPVAAAADRVLKGMIGGTGTSTGLTSGGGDPVAGRAAHRSAARRNIVNTYVWTAAGGLFSETTSTTDQVTSTTAGEYTVSGSATYQSGFEAEIGPVGGKFAFEATMGGGYTVTRRKTRDASRSFSLEVATEPGSVLHRSDGSGPVLVPGRVDAYRFMSFYLDTSTDNFEDFYGKVVDPEWLERGTDAGARELARARQSDRKPPCWRVLHRVTFVSRVQDTGARTPSLAQAMGSLGLSSDYALMRQLSPYLVGATTDPAELAAATTKVLTAHFTALVPYTDVIAAKVAAFHGLAADHLDRLPLAGDSAPTPASSLTVDRPSAEHGAHAVLGFGTPPGTASQTNWIGLYPVGVAPSQQESLLWEYAPGAGGSVTFATGKLPGPGEYAAWYLHNDGYALLAGPVALTVR
ncbi:LamG domain-containing protein [Streptomyces sp. PKU-MA01144]|uniref:LamG domain-containing protein n=1 Tax=Streptomyces sp. PKU-MA01144 TaxID=2729138 RepID=UPI00147E7E09|nr:LamG domain-containing protein [Streptomyces sp. PKU-MA01144]NNJ05088.1 LamG domain-containing protein [Streptomyces sp. PKU-MA01144]